MERMILTKFIDSEYGGWFQRLKRTDLQPDELDKGTVWTVNYHESMLYAEILRLQAEYPERVCQLARKLSRE